MAINEQTLLDFIVNFTSILYEAMPFIILGAVLAGVLEEMVPQELIAKVVPKNRLLAIALGALLGLVFPMCECGIVPVMRRLLRKRLPLSCCTAYMLAGPIINPVVMLSTWYAFLGNDKSPGWLMVTLRMLGGFTVGVGVSLVVEWQFRKHGYTLVTPLARPDEAPLPQRKPDEPAPEASVFESPAEEHQEEDEATHKTPSAWTRIGRITETSLHDFIDITVFLILGALLAALTRMLLPHQEIESFSYGYPVLAILSMMGLAILLCLCSEADAFVAASFTTLHPAAKLAFLVLGPMLDLKLYMMYTRVFRPRLIYTIFGSVIVLTFIYSMILHFAWPAVERILSLTP